MSITKENVLINVIYTGDYTKKNIGHEIINLYKTDKYIDNGEEKGGENYIYISPWGTISKKKYDYIKEVLFACGMGKNKLKIIGRASGLNYWGNTPIEEQYKQDVLQIIENVKNDMIENKIKWKKFYSNEKYINAENFINFAYSKITKCIQDTYKEKYNIKKLDSIDTNLKKQYKNDLLEKSIFPQSEAIHNLQLK